MTAETAKMADDAPIEGKVVKRNVYRGGGRSSLTPDKQLALKREIALRTDSMTELGKRYGLTQQGISEFKRRHELEIDDIRQNASDVFAGIPLAKKENRIAAYEREVELLNASSAHDHHEWSKARQMAYRSIAEELGQLPPRQTVTVIPVVHVVETVDLQELK